MDSNLQNFASMEWQSEISPSSNKIRETESNYSDLSISRNVDTINGNSDKLITGITLSSVNQTLLPRSEPNCETESNAHGITTAENSQSGNEIIKLQLNDPPDLDQILNCHEKDIEPTPHNVTVLNLACQKVLKEMEHILINCLEKNRKEQEMILIYLNYNGKPSFSEGFKKGYVKCVGMPYFKDLYGYPAPLNEDVLIKKKNKKLLPIQVVQNSYAWTAKDSKILIKAVLENYNKVPNKQSIDPNMVDWMKISALNLDGKYSASECKSMWLMNLSPEINKSSWSSKEMTKLRKVADKYKYQNWEKIAEELGTNRTCFQCCVQYQTHRSSSGEKWSKEEDEALLNVVNQFKIKDHIPWRKVVWNFEGRSLRQCKERFAYHLHNIKKGSFTTDEDFALLYLFSKLKSFREVAKHFPNRVTPQIRSRYEYLVRKTMPKFTQEEDTLLTQLMVKYPRNWKKISEHFENRSQLQCRRRWTEIEKSIPLKSDILSDSDEHENENENDNGLMEANNSKIKDMDDAKRIKKKLSSLPKEPRGTFNPKYSPQYGELLEYCKNGFKFLFGPKPRIPIRQDEEKILCGKLEVTMKILHVDSKGLLSNFKIDELLNNCEFDMEDVLTLCALKRLQENSEREPVEVDRQVFPPNYSTLIGLRSLFLSANNIQNSAIHYKNSDETNKVDTEEGNRVLFHDAKNLFKARLKCLFALPLMLSAISQDGIESICVPPKKTKKSRPMSKLAKKIRSKKLLSFRKNIKTSNDGKPPKDTEVLPIQSQSTEQNLNVCAKRKRGRPSKISKLEESTEAKKPNLHCS